MLSHKPSATQVDLPSLELRPRQSSIMMTRVSTPESMLMEAQPTSIQWNHPLVSVVYPFRKKLRLLPRLSTQKPLWLRPTPSQLVVYRKSSRDSLEEPLKWKVKHSLKWLKTARYWTRT